MFRNTSTNMPSGGVEVAPNIERDGGDEGAGSSGDAEEEDELVEMHTWASLVSDWSSCHGVVWYNRFYSGHLQKSAFALMLALMMGLPAIIIMELVSFVREVHLTDAILYTTAEIVRYPNVTFCHSRYFDKGRMRDYEVSDDMANYLTMSFDPALPNLVRYRQSVDRDFEDTLNELERDLGNLLWEYDLNVVELMEAIAVRCDEFVLYCEVHRKMYSTGDDVPDEENCCKSVLDDRPLFTAQGTCFYTKRRIYEAHPYTWSSVEVWLKFDGEQSPRMTVEYKGSDAVERNGVFFSVTNNDHPVSSLASRPFRTMPGTVATVALSVREITRSALGTSFCQPDNGDFESKYGVPFTKPNCDLITTLGDYAGDSNCSTLAYYRLEPDSTKRICLPSDLLNLPPINSDDLASLVPAGATLLELRDADERSDMCKFECERVEYLSHVQYGRLDEEAVEDMEDADGDGQLVTVVQMFFETFHYERHSLKKDTLLEFMSRVGGWMGLAVGASVISFAELVYFLVLLICLCCGYKIRRRS